MSRLELPVSDGQARNGEREREEKEEGELHAGMVSEGERGERGERGGGTTCWDGQ